MPRHAEGDDIYAGFLLRFSPRAEWKQYVTGGKGVKPVYEVLVGGPGLPAPNVNTNASAVLWLRPTLDVRSWF